MGKTGNGITASVISPNSRLAIFGMSNGWLVIYDMDHMPPKLIRTIPSLSSEVVDIQVSKDSTSQLMVLQKNGVATVYDLNKGKSNTNCPYASKEAIERKEVLESLEATGKEIVDITYDQMEHFAGNMLQVANSEGERFLVLSQAAFDSLKQDQLDALSALTNILPIPIKTIETLGGGSVRCMMAEVFLPLKN